jgi:UDP-GlcNAc:undecaprenyl-phosphate GlcNAc-1-phosphate transferase
MSMLPIAFALSFLSSLVLTRLVRALAARVGLVDKPDARRKMHAQATPVGGGIAILFSTVVTITVALLCPSSLQAELWEQASDLFGLLLAAVVICVVGVLDDADRLRGRHKVAGQLVAVAIVIGSGVRVEQVCIFQWEINLGLLAIPFTAFLLLGAVNSLNLLDGMDGLLSSVGLIVSLALGVMALLSEHWLAACVALALAGSLLGFLRYNFPPATIFLGDSGSMLLGLVVGVLAIQSSLKAPATIALVAPLATLAIPILDTTAAIIRRKLTGRSIYTTDRGHLHHCLLGRGLSSRVVLLLVSFFCLLTALGALASLVLKNELVAIVAALAVIAILIGVRLFGYAEFLLAKQHLITTTASFMHLRKGGEARATEVRLQGSADWKVLWNAFIDCAVQLNLKRVHLDVNAPAIHEGYHARWECREPESENPSLWFAEIPLMVGGQTVGRVELTGRRDHEPVWAKLARLSKLVEEVEVAVSTITDSQRLASLPGANGDPRILATFRQELARPEPSSHAALDAAG